LLLMCTATPRACTAGGIAPLGASGCSLTGGRLPFWLPQLAKLADYIAKPVVRGGIEPPAFRFSGLRITVQDRPRRSLWLLSGLRCTPMDAGVRRCMRLEMRLCLGP
jgi:hypothetical protein